MHSMGFTTFQRICKTFQNDYVTYPPVNFQDLLNKKPLRKFTRPQMDFMTLLKSHSTAGLTQHTYYYAQYP